MRILLDHFSKSFGSTQVIEDMNLEIRDGEMLALLGPSGCGKSTTLFAICGIHRVTGGRILFGDRDVSNLPSQERNVGVVFQSYALYPHMTVAENIAFPLTVKGLRKPDIAREVERIADLVHIGELLERRPSQLSGGQQQRAALARALIRKPSVLLLDEPLANLDAKLRLEMRSEIRRLQLETGITAILVTHDQVEAMSMCDRIAIMNAGRIIQVATPTEMYRNPATQFVAGFLGTPPIAFIRGTAADGRFAPIGGGTPIPLPSNIERPTEGSAVTLGIRPEDFGPRGDVAIPGRISFIETQGRENLYDVTVADGSVLRSIQPVGDEIRLGAAVDWAVARDKIMVFDEAGRRL
jgi:inositol-phosphate transport system ATP-binding protein